MDNDYTTSAGIDYKGQQFWGVRYIDDAVAKRIDRDNDGDWNEANADNYHYLTDVMFGVRALTDRYGYTRERIDYTPYGVATHRYAGDVTGEGTLDSNDTNAWLAQYNSNSPQLTPGDTGYSPYADLNGDGNLEPTFELTSIITPDISYVNTGSRGIPPAGWLTDPARTDGTDNAIGYDGYVFDLAGATDGSASGVYMVRNRVYDPGMGSWVERDPAGYVDGLNLYQSVSSSPLILSDPLGLSGSKPKLISGPGTVTKLRGALLSNETRSRDGMTHFAYRLLAVSATGAANDSNLSWRVHSKINAAEGWANNAFGKGNWQIGDVGHAAVSNSVQIECDCETGDISWNIEKIQTIDIRQFGGNFGTLERFSNGVIVAATSMYPDKHGENQLDITVFFAGAAVQAAWSSGGFSIDLSAGISVGFGGAGAGVSISIPLYTGQGNQTVSQANTGSYILGRWTWQCD